MFPILRVGELNLNATMFAGPYLVKDFFIAQEVVIDFDIKIIGFVLSD